MFSSERVTQLSNTASKVQWSLRFAFSYVQPVTQCYRRKTVEEDFKKCLCSNPVTTKIRQSVHLQLSVTASKVQQPLRFAFSYVQPVTKRHKRRTVLESCLQSIQSPRKIRTILTNVLWGSHALRYHESTPWAVSKKKWDTKEDKGKSMMRALYVLRYAKKHVSVRSDVKQ